MIKMYCCYSPITKTFRVVSVNSIDKIPVWWYIMGIPARAGLDVNVRRLCNWIFAQAKMAIV